MSSETTGFLAPRDGRKFPTFWVLLGVLILMVAFGIEPNITRADAINNPHAAAFPTTLKLLLMLTSIVMLDRSISYWRKGPKERKLPTRKSVRREGILMAVLIVVAYFSSTLLGGVELSPQILADAPHMGAFIVQIGWCIFLGSIIGACWLMGSVFKGYWLLNVMSQKGFTVIQREGDA